MQKEVMLNRLRAVAERKWYPVGSALEELARDALYVIEKQDKELQRLRDEAYRLTGTDT